LLHAGPAWVWAYTPNLNQYYYSITGPGLQGAGKGLPNFGQSSILGRKKEEAPAMEAVYLNLAQKSGLPLASEDSALKEAALEAGLTFFV
jgi:hypothetical protein